MERFAVMVLRHRGAVVLLWLVLLVAGVAAAGRLSDRLSFDFSLPGQPGYETDSSWSPPTASARPTPSYR